MNEYLNTLNNSQRQAVEDINGPSLIIAGAGSGKTRVLTYRVAHLLKSGVNPRAILALTFTNKAAREMKDRIADIVGRSLARDIWMGTFHSVFSKILRREAERLNYSSNYTIYDTTDSKNLVKSIIKEFQLDDKTYKPNQVFGRISFAKNNLITPDGYFNNAQLKADDNRSRRPRLADIYKRYSILCRKADAMDFDDLLLNTYILFNKHPDVLEQYQRYFEYILVDEYQDTNYVQHLIISQLASKNKNICVVGDDAQSIYSFRGALIENILNFKKNYPGCKVYKLEKNYRSTQLIVKAANSVIEKNTNRINKNLYSENTEGDKIELIENRNDTQEGFRICMAIKESVSSGKSDYKDHAILYRTNAQSRIFEEVMRNQNIPYKIYGSVSFYQRKEIKDVLAYFRLIINKRDDEALRRIINYPGRGIGKTTMGKIEHYANANNINLWDVISYMDKYDLGFNKGIQSRLKAFADFIDKYREKLATTNAYEIALGVVKEAGILQELDFKKAPENLSRYENVQELLDSINEFTDANTLEGQVVTLSDYIESVSLLTGEEKEDEQDVNRVSIMTVHAAKGLEFDNVYIVGVEENLFPSSMNIFSSKDLEEERRLFYVAMTRAKKKIVVSYATERFRWGSVNFCRPSRFIKDIDEEFVFSPEGLTQNSDMNNVRPIKQGNHYKPKESVASVSPKNLVSMSKASRMHNHTDTFESDNADAIQVGMQVEHQRFGRGKVLNIEGQMPNSKATVFFQNEGQKQLLLKFAKLKIV